jgi:O-antigen ligase
MWSMPEPEGRLGSQLERLAFLCLAAFVFAVPWEQVIQPFGGMLPVRWISLALLGIAMLRMLVLRRFRKPASVHYPMVALAAWSAVTALWSANPMGTVVRAATYAQLLVLVWLVWELAPNQRRVSMLLAAYAGGAMVSSLETVRNALSGRTAGDVYGEMYGIEGSWGQRFTAGGFNVNDLGLLLALGIPMTVYLLCRAESRAGRIFYLLQLVSGVTAVALTGSRGSAGALLVALAMVPLSVPFWSRGMRRIAPAAAAAGVLFAIYTVPAPVWQRLRGAGAEIEQGTMSHRTTIWAAGMDVFLGQPIEGVGAAAFPERVMSRLAKPSVAHNTFVSVLVELGVIGALILLALLAALFYSAAKMPRLEARLWMVTLAAWCTGVSTGTWEYQKATWLLFGLAAAHAAACHRARSRSLTLA